MICSISILIIQMLFMCFQIHPKSPSRVCTGFWFAFIKLISIVSMVTMVIMIIVINIIIFKIVINSIPCIRSVGSPGSSLVLVFNLCESFSVVCVKASVRLGN